MSIFKVISINITLETANDLASEPPQSPTPLADQLRCEQFYSCSSDYCAKHGCRNVLPSKPREVRS